VDVAGLGSCRMTGFGISGVDPSGSSTSWLVATKCYP
jgi:hypothetical protein